jgi:hypothetical protein
MATLIKIDELTIEEHRHLSLDDECYYACTYTSGKDYTFSDANSKINNLKKSPLLRDTPQWRFKTRAINLFAQVFSETIPGLGDINNMTFVPIPSSKARDHEEYDPRMSLVLAKIKLDGFDYRELLYNETSRASFHTASNRRDIDELEANLRFDEDLIQNLGDTIVLVDDMVTTGASFCACRNVILNRFPGKQVIGLFASRRTFPDAADVFGGIIVEEE